MWRSELLTFCLCAVAATRCGANTPGEPSATIAREGNEISSRHARQAPPVRQPGLIVDAPTTPTIPAPPSQPSPTSAAASHCDRGASMLESLETMLAAGYAIVHVRPPTVASSRTVALVGQGAYGRALALERSHFEASVIRSCGRAITAGTSLRLNRPTRQRHERPDGTWEVLDVDPLRGGPTGAAIRDREDSLLIVTPDSQAPGEWLVLGAIELRAGAIAARIYNSDIGSDAAAVISACNDYRATRGGSR